VHAGCRRDRRLTGDPGELRQLRSYSLVGTGVLSSPGTIELDCVGSTNQSFGPLVDNNHLVAVPVDALN